MYQFALSPSFSTFLSAARAIALCRKHNLCAAQFDGIYLFHLLLLTFIHICECERNAARHPITKLFSEKETLIMPINLFLRDERKSHIWVNSISGLECERDRMKEKLTTKKQKQRKNSYDKIQSNKRNQWFEYMYLRDCSRILSHT